MGAKIPQPIGVIRMHGIVDIPGLLKMMRDWFIDRRYDLTEKTFKSKAGGDGIKKEIEWSASRDINEYIKYNIDVEMVFANIMDVEVVKAGQKMKLQSARVQIKITTLLEVGQNKKWESHPFIKKAWEFYYNNIIKRDVFFIYADGLYNNALQLHRKIKEHLALEAVTQ